MSKLKQFAFHFLVLALSVLVSRAAYRWDHLVSDPMDTLQASLIVGLAGGVILSILRNLPIGKRDKK